jgi:hypothetical protein
LLNEHAILSFSFAIAGITSVLLQHSQCSWHDVMQGQPQSWETKTMMTMTVGQLRHKDKDNNDNDSEATTSASRMIVIPH